MTAVKSKEAELRDQVSDLKQKLSDSENARNLLSRDLASAQKQAAKAGELEAQVKQLQATLEDRGREIGRLQADVASANARAAQADVVLDAARGLKRLVEAV